MEEKLARVFEELEQSPPTLAHLSEAAFSEAEAAVANAKRLLRKGSSPGDIRFATQQAIDAVQGERGVGGGRGGVGAGGCGGWDG